MKNLLVWIVLFVSGQVLAQTSTITLEDIWQDRTFTEERVPGFNFLQDGQHYTRLIDNQIQRFDLTTGDMVEVIFDGSQVNEDYKIGSYRFSKDEKSIILEAKKDRIFRRSYVAEYMILKRNSQELIPVYDLKKVSYATLDPSSNRVAFVFENNLYYQELGSGKVVQVTEDGKKNEIINGHTDWVYEEEFGFVKAFYWSPEGQYLGFIRFDEREVPEFTMTLHHDNQYPTYQTFKYPKVGEKNSVVSALIYDLNSGKTTSAEIGDMSDMYIPRMRWSTSEKGLCIYKMNRHQNHLQIFLANPQSGEASVMLEEKNKYYIDIHDNLTFVDKGKCFLWTSEKDGNNHVYLYSIKGKEKKQVTKGDWEVTSFYGYDDKRDWIYYQSTEPGSMERAIYRIHKNGSGKEKVAAKAGYNSAQFSSTFDYYVLQQSSSFSPPVYNVMGADGNVVRPLVDNSKVKGQLTEYKAIAPEFKEITVGEGVKLNTAVIKPRSFDPSKKYPLLMYLYGGPGSQQVANRWNSFRYFWWFQLLANEGYMVAIVDNRGTGGRGEEYKKMTYMQLGKYETEDQINAAKHFGNLDYVDESRIGIFGWSYGGYMSSLCLLKGNDVFKSAIAVAPVTSWKWYDSIYTERYMRTLVENESGYKDNSPVYFADRLKGNYLLVHGMADDNVHFQNTAEMAKALVAANKQFDTYFYTNKNHGIYGGPTRLHLFTKITDFVKNKI